MAIAGAGCSGVSAAIELASARPDLSITLFDPSPEPPADRTWCFWEMTRGRYADMVCQRWDRVVVRSREREAEIDVAGSPYACLRAADFYRFSGQLLDGAHARVERGVTVESITDQGGDVAVELMDDAGDARDETFDLVLDGRPPERVLTGGREPSLVQHFVGLELNASASPIDASVATLMDFAVDQSRGAHFMYVLPLSGDRVLVESTFMTATVETEPGPIDYEGYVRSYAGDVLGLRDAPVVYRESGALPMTVGALGDPGTPRIWPIGTRAGVGRPSSGYAFDAIQRDSVRVADAIVRGRVRPRPPRSPLLSAMDRVLISMLESDASFATRVFPALFAQCRPERLVRFLADVPGALDYLAVMLAMPKAAVIGHVLRSPRSWPVGGP